jgi:GNAT superfamily N-acetyltransferase
MLIDHGEGSFELMRMFVRQLDRRSGVATKLIDKVIEESRAAGGKLLFLKVCRQL